MKNYDIRICSCGRIHALPYKTLEETVYSNGENNKDIALICGRCGKIQIIGADYVPNYFDDPKHPMVYDCYTRDFYCDSIREITPESFDKPTKIFYSKGYGVPMMSGEYATAYDCKFSDMTYPDLYELDRRDITPENVHQFIEDYNTKRTTVNMARFIRETPDDVLKDVSNRLIDQFDWKDTEYENKWNS